MASRWICQAGKGTSSGLDFANAAPISDFVAQEAAVGNGEPLYFSAETITLPFILTNTAIRRFVGVNATTGVNDGSLAVLDGGNTYANCMIASSSSSHFENLEFIRATGDGLNVASQVTVFNCKARNNGGVGINLTSIGTMAFCSSLNNSGYGISLAYAEAIYCTTSGNSYGFWTVFASIVKSITIGNTIGIEHSKLIDSCIIDGNTTGLSNTGRARPCLIIKSSITNNTTGIATGANISERVEESRNYFYNNTTNIGGTVANTFSLGGSIAGTIDPYINRSGGDFKPSATAPGLGFPTPFGILSEATNLSYENMGLNPAPPNPPITVSDIDPATGAIGATITITGTNFSGSGNVVKLGGSGGTSCVVTSESATSIDFTVPAISTGTYDVYIENSGGANIVVPNGFILTSAVVPVFAGITHFEILSNNKFYIKTGTATNSPIYLVYYIRTATNPFGIDYSFKLAYSENKELVIGEESGHFAPLVAGTTYYCGVRAENANGEDTNTAELSNICSGTAMIQRQTITVLSAK